jgi:hypothetical protein
MNKEREIDPGILEILGGLSTLIGLSEQVAPGRIRVAFRNRKVDRLLERFKANLDDARMALRSLTSVIERLDEDIPRGAISFSLSSTEFAIYRRSLEQLQSAISKLTDTSHNLEATLVDIDAEAERFYRISQAGRPVLKSIANALKICISESNLNHDVRLSNVLKDVDKYLSSCSNYLEQRSEWLYQ